MQRQRSPQRKQRRMGSCPLAFPGPQRSGCSGGRCGEGASLAAWQAPGALRQAQDFGRDEPLRTSTFTAAPRPNHPPHPANVAPTRPAGLPNAVHHRRGSAYSAIGLARPTSTAPPQLLARPDHHVCFLRCQRTLTHPAAALPSPPGRREPACSSPLTFRMLTAMETGPPMVRPGPRPLLRRLPPGLDIKPREARPGRARVQAQGVPDPAGQGGVGKGTSLRSTKARQRRYVRALFLSPPPNLLIPSHPDGAFCIAAPREPPLTHIYSES